MDAAAKMPCGNADLRVARDGSQIRASVDGCRSHSSPLVDRLDLAQLRQQAAGEASQLVNRLLRCRYIETDVFDGRSDQQMSIVAWNEVTGAFVDHTTD